MIAFASVADASEPDLHLLTDAGLEIAPILFDGKVYAFVVPGGVRQLRLRSRVSRSAETTGLSIDDRRAFGVLVGDVGVSTGRRRRISGLHLSTQALAGWHDVERQATCRWTDGDASLPVDLSMSNGCPVFLDIQVIQAGPYEMPSAGDMLPA